MEPTIQNGETFNINLKKSTHKKTNIDPIGDNILWKKDWKVYPRERVFAFWFFDFLRVLNLMFSFWGVF